MIVIDGNSAVVGRVSARVAKMLLKGEDVHIVNAEKMVISGKLNVVADKYKARRRVLVKTNPEHAPKWPKVPDMLVRRIVRGMLPWDSMRGRQAFRRLRVHMGVPASLVSEAPLALEGVSSAKFKKKMTVLELCNRLGYID